jgi:uncharacterized repeat protein (TIGR01451 family)
MPPLLIVLRRGFLVTGLLGLGCGLAFAAPAPDLSQQAQAEIRALLEEKASWTPAQCKLESHLIHASKQHRSLAFAPGAPNLKLDVETQPDGRVLVDVKAEVSPALLALIKQGGGQIIGSYPQFHAVRALVTLDQLDHLAGSPDVKSIRRAAKATTNTGSVTSQGDVTHRANLARSAFGVSGQGVRIGVLSDSIDYLAGSQTTGDLGEVTVLPGQSGVPGSGEGTAMLEIIHDLAPSAQLYFATAFNGEASFAQNILNLRSNGCQVIIDDVYYYDESPFQDAIIARAVNSVTTSGALYFSAAGNDGNLKDGTSGTWEGDFVDGGPAGVPVNIGGGTVHSFGSTTFNSVVSGGQGVDLFWADPLGASTNDYDLFLLDATGTYVVASSLNLQNGTQDPYENLSVIPGQGDRIVIVKTSGAGRFLHLVTSRGKLSTSTAGATRGHSATAAGYGVAAVDVATSYPFPFSGGGVNPVETFSSDGPRRIFFNSDGSPITPGNYSSTGGTVLQKPDIAAADGVATSLPYPFDPFFGTSAAAPHAGAIAALLLSYDPALSPSQVRNALTTTALDIEDAGPDRNSGAGIVMAYAALQALPARPVIVAGPSTFLAEFCPNGSLDPGERVTVSLTLTNLGPASTTHLVATLLSSGGITSPSGPRSYGALTASGGATNQAFSFTASGSCGGTNVATLQLQDGTNDLGTVSFNFPLGKTRGALAENFDGVTPPALPPGWSVSWSGAGVPWITTSGFGDSSPNSAFAPDPYGTSDNALLSPAIPIISSTAQLTFRHSINTYYYYSYYDGGVLEISTNGGAFVDIIAAGGSFVANGYSATLYTGYGNPLGGRMAWSGYSGGFRTTIVNLPATAAGQNVQLRWRFGSSYYYGGSGGWYIDTVSVTDGLDCCVPVSNDIAVGISASPDPAVVGATLTYTITVVNTGPTAANNVMVTDALPPGFSLQSLTTSPPVGLNGHGTSGSTITLDVGTIPGGSGVNITVVGSPGSVGLITNQVTVARGEPDANLANNTATAVTSVTLPHLSIKDVSLLEGNSGTTNAAFTVSLSAPVGKTVMVSYATSNQTALAGIDYVAASGTLVFAPGVTSRTILVPVIGNTLNELDKTFLVTLSNPTNADLATSQATGTIINDDPLPNLSISDATVAQPESGTTNAVFTVSLSAPSGQSLYAYYFTSNGTATASSDYVPVYSTQLTFLAGETNKTITIVVNNHATVRPAQSFYVALASPFNAKITRGMGLGTITTARPGHADHFVWSAISSPKSVGGPFAVTLTAQDYWNSPATNFNGRVNLFAVRGGVSGLTGLRPGAVVPYFSDHNPSATGPAPPIARAGFTPLQVADISTLNLNSYTALFIDEVDNNSLSSALLGRLPEIRDWVINGGTLIVHDWSAGNLNPNPFLLGTTGIQTVRDGTSDIDVILPGTNLVVAGPFGTIDNTTLDGGNSSAHGYVPQDQLPSSALPILSIGGNPNQVVDFSYSLGLGVVYYSSIPLDCYLAGGGCSGSPIAYALQQIYTPNVLAYLSNPLALPPVSVSMVPTNSGSFSNGVWQGQITVTQQATNVTLLADDGRAHTGSSNPFDVQPAPGQITSFAWNPVSSPQTSGVPFTATIIAQDFYRTTATNFNGTVALSATGATLTSNTILPSLSHQYYSSGPYTTYGYSFTPNTDMTVTHLRHYFGTKVSIWTDAGVLLASQSVGSAPGGTWRETALASPVKLSAGTTYRVAVYTGSWVNYYYRTDMASAFPNGIISQSYEASGDGFPTNADYYNWVLVDLKYTVATPLPGPISMNPAISANFTNGVWRASVTAERWGANVVVRADDGLGHTGSSNPFDVAPGLGQIDHLVWNPVASPQAVGEPFGVSVTAQDFYNTPATNFTGTVALSGSWARVTATNTILPSPSYLYYDYGYYNTYGYTFTPNTNMTVTHVRHYFGTKVSIWTDAGVLLASRSVSSAPGTWVETPLTTPIQLTAGTRYRVAAYTGGGYYYYRTDMSPAFPCGTINQSCYASGDGFPSYTDSAQWWFVDLTYTVSSPLSGAITPEVSGNFTNGNWSGSVSVTQPATDLVLRAADGNGHSGTSSPINVMARGQVDHFIWSPIASPQSFGVPFGATLTAQDYFNSTTTNFNGSVVFSTSGSNSVALSPVNSGKFTNGVWSGSLTALAASQPASNVVVRADDGSGHTGSSNPFNLMPAGGQIDHLVWSSIASPQAVGEPFGVTVTARDYYNTTASNFTGTVTLSGLERGGLRTNTMFGNITPSNLNYNGTYTVGNAFTPNTDITVTHVRHYFGTKVSLWTDTGVLLASQAGGGTNAAGSWMETALPTPVQLSAGQTYRVAVYTAGDYYYWRNDQSSTFSDGTIKQGYETGGDGFPVNTDSMQWWLVDIRYTVGSVVSVPVTPTTAGDFSNGVWQGNITVTQPATNVTLLADDGSGHAGSSSPFNVGPRGQVDHFVWSAIASPQTSGVPFGVTLSAQDYFNSPATNFNGTVALNATGVALATNTILPSLSHQYYSSGPYSTFGYAFTPNTNMTVTHLRHYFGTKVSIWTDAGVLLASQSVGSAPGGTWRETALASPVKLSAGTTYRVAVYTGSWVNYYYRTDMASAFPNGTISQSYEASGDGFPTNADYYNWVLVDLKYTVGSPVPLVVSPANSGNFTNGTWSGSVAVPTSGQPVTDVVLRAEDANGHNGSGNPFNVVPAAGQIDHLVWSPIASPREAGAPFGVTITAQDYHNTPASNFNGTVTLSGSWPGALSTNSILPSPSYYDYNYGYYYTFGYAFTPSTNITVTHFRHYFGTKVSIWTDAGVLLASRSVTSVNGTWVETPLSTPIQLTAGTRYRVAAYAAGDYYYWRTDMASAFPNGTINQSYAASGDAFPSGSSSAQWYLVDLKYTVSSPISVAVTPGVSGNFTNGVWSGSVSVAQQVNNLVLRAEDANGHTGSSNPFIVVPAAGQIDHLVWSSIASPEFNGAPFAVTLTARDYYNNTATNFAGTVTLSGSWSGAVATNTILPSPSYYNYNYGSYYTFGYTFTPNTNITVTHVRHYFGTKVSIWTDAGVLLASRSVTSVNGAWVETPLTTPIQLTAGMRYRVAVYTGDGYSYWRSDMASAFPNGTIDQSCYASGDAFPSGFDSAQWYLVDLKYAVSSALSVAVTPSVSGNFSNGVWSGSVSVAQQVNNVVLRADDGNGHNGSSNPFNVVPGHGQIDHLVWSPIASPEFIGVPFAVSLTAWDYYNGAATNFTGKVALSGSWPGGTATNTILPAPSYLYYNSGYYYTFGFAFTPNTNMTVTHVRHYFGTKVSIWTDAGVLLASRNVSSVPGTWVETSLTTPIQLTAGTRYRVAAYTGGGSYYYRTDMGSAFPNGTINQSCYASGDGFPGSSDSAQWYFVDLKYTVSSPISVAVTPSVSGNFTNGGWSGSLSVPQGATNLVLQADDGNSHTGLSSPFNVIPAPQPPLIVMQPASRVLPVRGFAAFSAVASGTAPLSFQWRKDGLPIAGATGATYWILNAQTNDGASYSLIVTNLAGFAVSSNAMLTIVNGGTIVAWGDNSTGQTNVPPGLNDVLAVAGGYGHSLALRKDGSVQAWGDDSVGQTDVPSSVSNVVAIASGYYHSLALRRDGTVAAWGDNSDSQSTVPPGLSDIMAIAGGGFHSLALRSNGTVVAWGYNGDGQTSPPAGLSDVVGIAGGAFHSLALRKDGTIVAWGYNSDGEINVPAGAASVAMAVAGGRFHSVSALRDGTLAAWGYNGSGQSTVPAGLSNVVTVAGGGDHSLALRSDGSVAVWGYNAHGQAAPPPGLNKVAAIASGYDHCLALVANDPPTLLTQPQDLTVSYGAGAYFGANYGGAVPMGFQWQKNGSDLGGSKSATLQLAAVTRADAATYRVIVTNVFGSITSSNAVLRVLVPQEIQFASRDPDGVFHLWFEDALGGGLADPANIQVQAATNLLRTNTIWIVLTNGHAVIANGLLRFDDPNAGSFSRKFYRVIER